jgi:hypothetical protein
MMVGGQVSATELYALDFSQPEVGAYQTVFGSPSVQHSVGPFTDALVFDAVTSHEQIQLQIGTVGSRYDIKYDVLVHGLSNSQYDFGLLLDTPEVRTLDFHGGLNAISVFQPYPYTLRNIAGFVDDRVYHVGVTVDLAANLWSVAIDGTQRFVNPYNAAGLQSIRFDMSPWIVGATNSPQTYAVIDNVSVAVVPEPTVFSLFLATVPVMALAYRRKQRVALAAQKTNRSNAS